MCWRLDPVEWKQLEMTDDRDVRGTPFSVAISMNGLDSTLMIAARVMRIICATTTAVSVIAGSATAYRCWAKLIPPWTRASEGKIWTCTASR